MTAAEAAAAIGVAGAVLLYAAGWTISHPFDSARAPSREALRRKVREPRRWSGRLVRAAAGAACFGSGAVLLFAVIARAGVRIGVPSVPLELGAVVAAAAIDALVGATLRDAAARAVRTACAPRRRRSARRTPPS